MKFTRITDGTLNAARKAGYVLDLDHPQSVDTSCLRERFSPREIERILDYAADSVCDNDSDAYLGEDGNIYAVGFYYGFDVYNPIPIVWNRLKKADVKGESI